MKIIRPLLILVAVTQLTSCASAWMFMYRAKGGYYNQSEYPKKQHIDQ